MKYVLNLADIRLCLDSERLLRVEEEWEKFLIHSDSKYDIKVQVSWNWEHALRPISQPLGNDTILEYYKEENFCFCNTRAEKKGSLTSTSYHENMENMVCTINEKPYLNSPNSVGWIVRSLPMREILLHFNVLFFHAAQVSYQGTGILFSAPSGTGKTTQARLWEKFKGAEVVCNDRTLVRKGMKGYKTYSYPLDGSEPIASTRVNRLGTIILLEQGKRNELKKISMGKKLSMLMEQLVMDCWNPDSRERNMLLLLEMIKEIPVYHFLCTPDAEAVDVLWNQLIKEGVIESGQNQ